MPVFPDADIQSAKPDQKGVFKAAYPHRTQDEMLVLRYHEGTDATTETRWTREMQDVLTPEEAQSYAISRFYLRKILHVMNPTFFPDCHFSSSEALVVEKKSGTEYSWEELPAQSAREIEEMLEQLQLPLRFLDTSGSENFHKTPDGFSYVDSVVNSGYFSLLHLLRTQDKSDVLPQNEHLATAHFSILAHAYLYFDHCQQIQEVSSTAVETYLKEHHLDEQDDRKIRQFFIRYKRNLEQFPTLDQSEVGKALAELVDMEQDKFLRDARYIGEESIKVYMQVLLKHKPLLYAKFRLRLLKK